MVERVKAIWKAADCVCFDVDSTVTIDEGIDKLAEFLGKGDEVAALWVKHTCDIILSNFYWTIQIRALQYLELIKIWMTSKFKLHFKNLNLIDMQDNQICA